MEADRLVLMIKWSEASMISYTLSPCATRSTWKQMTEMLFTQLGDELIKL